jgi:hypothetical protein
MLKKDLMLRNPLRLIGYEGEDILGDGEFGAVLARAGVGKTAFLVQLALNNLLRGRNVLHISLDDPVNKVVLWYKEVLRNITDEYNLRQIDELWEAILPHRFIMTFKVEGFSVPKLKERLTDLTEQGIFFPKCLLIDGFPFDGKQKEALSQLKTLARDNALSVWFACRTHRHEPPGPDGVPVPLVNIDDLFEVIVALQPEGRQIHVQALKGGEPTLEGGELVLDPDTMLIKNKS